MSAQTAILLLFGGFIILCVGVVGLYVGRIFEQVRQRPLFLVDREIGWGAAEAGATVDDEGGGREPTAGL